MFRGKPWIVISIKVKLCPLLWFSREERRAVEKIQYATKTLNNQPGKSVSIVNGLQQYFIWNCMGSGRMDIGYWDNLILGWLFTMYIHPLARMLSTLQLSLSFAFLGYLAILGVLGLLHALLSDPQGTDLTLAFSSFFFSFSSFPLPSHSNRSFSSPYKANSLFFFFSSIFSFSHATSPNHGY